MDFYKKLIHNINCKKTIISQITLEEDYIVPDSKSDINKIIQDESFVVVDEANAMQGHVNISGNLKFKTLYITDDAMPRLECINGEIPFNEIINIEEADTNDIIKIKWEIEDFSINMVNSRKISTRALITFMVSIDSLTDEGVCTEIRNEENARVLTQSMDIMELAVNKKDIYRIKDEISIPSNKPNIESIIWESCQIRNVDIRPEEGMLAVKGELLVFIIYQPQEENSNVVWHEGSINFSGSVECSNATPDMTADIDYNMVGINIEARADFDGELRVVGIDGTMELNIKLYENNNITYIEDVYCQDKDVIINEIPKVFQRLIVKNISRCKIAERTVTENERFRILQICNCKADVKIEESMVTDGGINAEGIISLSVLYVTSDDKQPFDSLKATIPFTHFIQAEGINEKSKISLNPRIEQITAAMAGADELEIKCVIGIDTFVCEILTKDMIDTADEKPIDYEKLEEMSGIAVYIAQNNENLWKLAKKYYTTVEKIKLTNNLTSDEVKQGERIIIVKDIS